MKKIVSLFLLTASLAVQAQNIKITTEDIVLRREEFQPVGLGQLKWIKGTNDYAYIKSAGVLQELMVATAGSKAPAKMILTLDDLNKKIRESKVAGLNEVKRFPRITWINAAEFTFVSGKLKATYNIQTAQLTSQPNYSYPEGAAGFDVAPNTGMTAYTVENNLYILQNGNPVSVTNDKEKNIVNGQSVHRDEFGIYKGTFWSPSGKLLAYYRMDQTMVTDYPIMDLTQKPASAEMIKYPMAGAASHHVTLGVYNTEDGTVVFINTGEPKEQYLTNVCWSPDNKSIYIAILNRDQNHLKMNRYNASTGAFERTLFEEKKPTYVQPLHTMLFVPKHDDWFIWQSERDGMNHLYLYNTNGELVKAHSETEGMRTGSPVRGPEHNFVITDVLGCDPSGSFVYYVAAPLNQIGREVWKSELKTAKKTKIAGGVGTHIPSFNDTYTYFLDEYSDVNTPKVQALYNTKGDLLMELNRATNPLANYASCALKLFTIKAADDKTPLWCKMLLPTGFDSTKKYPTMTYVYNGPGVQLVTNTWMAGNDMFLYYMAQQGFVVFVVDGRGSQNRGADFEQATFRKLGTVEMDDQERGAQYLKSLKYVDGNRMAVFGWSYGGFMTTSLMTRKAGLYKTGVAGGPVIDWSMYEVMYTERFMDTPEANKEGYNESNLLNHAGKLQGKLLLIHGTSDDVVVWQHSLNFLKACVDQKTLPDYFVYPGHFHNVIGKDRAHLYSKIAEYIIANT
jgi:dipeptidyl-peptidase 4